MCVVLGKSKETEMS